MTIVPLFQLYDHSWLPPGTKTKKESLEYAHRTGVVCTDEMILHPDPYPDRESWCADRVKESERRLVRPRPRREDRARQPLATGPPADGQAAVPRVRTVVRHYPDRRLAHSVPSRSRRLWPLAHPAHNPLRWRPVRGGLARLPTRVEQARQAPSHAQEGALGMIEHLLPAGVCRISNGLRPVAHAPISDNF